MNERIKELAIQAAGKGFETFATSDFDSPAKIQKFAELIVRECMDIISDESEKVSDEWRCKDGKHIWWKIKEHFGVRK